MFDENSADLYEYVMKDSKYFYEKQRLFDIKKVVAIRAFANSYQIDYINQENNKAFEICKLNSPLFRFCANRYIKKLNEAYENIQNEIAEEQKRKASQKLGKLSLAINITMTVFFLFVISGLIFLVPLPMLFSVVALTVLGVYLYEIQKKKMPISSKLEKEKERYEDLIYEYTNLLELSKSFVDKSVLDKKIASHKEEKVNLSHMLRSCGYFHAQRKFDENLKRIQGNLNFQEEKKQTIQRSTGRRK